MARLLIPLLLFVYSAVNAQRAVPHYKATYKRPLDLSPEAAAKFEINRKAFLAVMEKIKAQGDSVLVLTKEEIKTFEQTDETIEDYWDVTVGGRIGYCCSDIRNISASSELAAKGSNTYGARNSHDVSNKTAWVEGAVGYGVGEYLVYEFAPDTPVLTGVAVINGYVKSEKAYLENTRVKKMLMYLNDKPFAMLELADERSIQVFTFKPIGNTDRTNLEALKLQPAWKLKFEIMEVYLGLKYDDVAITEIFFTK